MEWKRVLGNFTRKIMSLNRRSKRSILVATDVMGAVIILWLAYVMRLSEWWPEFYLFNSWKLFLFAPLAAILVFTKMGLYRVVMRAIGPRFFGLAGLSVCLLTLALCIFIFLFEIRPRTVPVIFGIILWLYLCGSRLFAQSFFVFPMKKLEFLL